MVHGTSLLQPITPVCIFYQYGVCALVSRRCPPRTTASRRPLVKGRPRQAPGPQAGQASGRGRGILSANRTG